MRIPAFSLFVCLLGAPALGAAAPCATGVYANERESVVIYERPEEGGLFSHRYLFVDGRRGTLGAPDAEATCAAGAASSTTSGALNRIDLRETDTTFSSGALTLKGRLIEPRSGQARTLVVFVHGSESTPTVGFSPYPYALAAQGVSVFVYDKRGTGGSDGVYNQDFHALAADATEALRQARRMGDGRYDRIGYFGGSQGGWIAPLAANSAKADFVVVGFGLVLSPLEEDAEQVYDELRRAHYGEDVLTKAREVTAATGEVVATQFSPESIAALKSVKKKFSSEKWISEIEGEFTGDVLRASDQDLAAKRVEGFQDMNVPWRHDAVGVVRALAMPQLWVIAGEDTVAPGLVTQQRLAALQDAGAPITTALFPDTDHGMIEFTLDDDGSRRYTRITEGYLRLIADYMKGGFSPPYGRAEIVPPKSER